MELFPTPFLKEETLATFHENSKDLLSSFLAMPEVDILFECTLNRALMQRLLSRVPKWVGNNAKGAYSGNLKK